VSFPIHSNQQRAKKFHATNYLKTLQEPVLPLALAAGKVLEITTVTRAGVTAV
jgi:hypothetical protein